MHEIILALPGCVAQCGKRHTLCDLSCIDTRKERASERAKGTDTAQQGLTTSV